MKPNKVDDKKPQELERLDSLLDSPEYAGEEKIDGCHYNMIDCRFFSTRIAKGKDIPVEKTGNFPHLTQLLDSLNFPNLVLDGEIFIPGETSQYVTRATGAGSEKAIAFQKENGWVKYKLFDILRTPRGTWLNKIPYIKRREFLERFFHEILDPLQKELGVDYFELVDMSVDNKREMLEKIYASGGEGMVLKKLDSRYMFGKNPKWVWMKHKKKDELDAVIMGYDPPKRVYKGKRIMEWLYWEEAVPVTKFYALEWIGAVRVGQYDDTGELRYIASISGLTESLRKQLSEDGDEYIGTVVKVGFMEYTDDGNLRHPQWKGFHPDKNPEECICSG